MSRKPPLQIAVDSKLTNSQLLTIVRSYAHRVAVSELHSRTGISRNTLYWYYGVLRERLVAVRYYSEWPAFTRDNPHAYRHVADELRRRRGMRDDNLGWHVSELNEWKNAFDADVVLKHIHQILRLTGPLDREPDLSRDEMSVLNCYVAFARTDLIRSRLAQKAGDTQADQFRLDETTLASEELYRKYLAARKRLNRSQS